MLNTDSDSGEVVKIGDALEEDSQVPAAVNTQELERNVSDVFQGYVQELLQPQPGQRQAIDMQHQQMHAVQVDDLLRQDMFNPLVDQMPKNGPGPEDHHNPMAGKRRKGPANPNFKESTTPGAKEKPTKKTTSSLRKLQNKLSQQRFRQRKRHAEAAQQSELDRMLSKIGSLETAKTELPKLQSENGKLQSSLEVKDKEIVLLKKEIAMVKKKKQEKQNQASGSGGGEEEDYKEDQIKTKLLEVTTREYETMLSTLKDICADYENGVPRDDDMVAQRRIAPVLCNFVDMTYHQSSKPCVKSLLAASLAYLGRQGTEDADLLERLSKVVDSLGLSTAQEMKIMSGRANFLIELDLLYKSRQELNQVIRAKFADSLKNGQPPSNSSSDFLADVDNLKENLLCEYQLRQNFQVSLFRLLQPIQIMKIILGSDPIFPDLVGFANIIALGNEAGGADKTM